jgi:tetratricopeptide (TPR) repeat protein
MAGEARLSAPALKEFAMRHFPAALALSLAVALTASIGQSAERQPDPRAVVLEKQGEARLEAGDVQGAIDAFEAALAVDPGHTPIYLDLGEAARREGLHGKAIHFYREALEREPNNLAAIAGEGAALVEKGALEKAKRNLSKLETMCGANCRETKSLAAAIARGPQQPVLTAEAVTPAPVVTQN